MKTIEKMNNIMEFMYDNSTNEDIITFDDLLYYYDDTITEEEYEIMYQKIKEIIETCDYYNSDNEDYIQLNDNHTMWQINFDEYTGTEWVMNLYLNYRTLVNYVFEIFKEKTNVELYALGTNGRHICVENNYDNAKNYLEFVKIQQELEEAVIKSINNGFGGF